MNISVNCPMQANRRAEKSRTRNCLQHNSPKRLIAKGIKNRKAEGRVESEKIVLFQ